MSTAATSPIRPWHRATSSTTADQAATQRVLMLTVTGLRASRCRVHVPAWVAVAAAASRSLGRLTAGGRTTTHPHHLLQARLPEHRRTHQVLVAHRVSEEARHLAQRNGPGRDQLLQGIPTKPGYDRDEAPAAVLRRKVKADVRYVPSARIGRPVLAGSADLWLLQRRSRSLPLHALGCGATRADLGSPVVG